MSKISVYIALTAIILVWGCDYDINDEAVTEAYYDLDGWEVSRTSLGTWINERDIFFVNAQLGFIVGYNGNIYKTTDAGKSWEKKNSGTTLHLFSVFFLNENVGFVGGETMRSCLNEDCGKGSVFLKTTDGGETWTKTFFSNYQNFHSLKFYDDSKGIAIITMPSNAVDLRMAKTTDGGNTWKLIDLAIRPPYDKFFSVDNMVFVAGDKQKIFKSKDYGDTWETISTPLALSDQVLNIYFYNENIGFVGGVRGYKTYNGGLDWEKINSPFSTLDVAFGIFHFYSETEGFHIRGVSKNEGGEFPAFKGSIHYRTLDGGESWSESALIESLQIGITHFPQRDVGYGVSGRAFFTINKKK